MDIKYEWDEAKSRSNVERGRIGFEAMENFEWETARTLPSDRYGESRWIATGYIGVRLHRVVYTERGDKTRIISLRVASRREQREHAKA